MKIISPTERPVLKYLPWDERYPLVYKDFMNRLEPLPSFLSIEHIGSTSIPGCGGKGIIDLLGIYEEGSLDSAKSYLVDLGFERQGNDFQMVFPDDRPMYLGDYHYEGEDFVMYIHVLHESSDEIRRFREFRELLIANPKTMKEYSEMKCELARTVEKKYADEYSQKKGPSIRRFLGDHYELHASDKDSPDES